jgi:aldose 1-epimerase
VSDCSSGSVIALSSGGDRVVIDPRAGARITSLLAGGDERIVARPEGATAAETTWGCFPMAPWPGRVADARFEWAGQSYPLKANLTPHAIHGVVFDAQWSVDEAGADHATLSCDLDRARWPLGGRVQQAFRLRPGALEIEGVVRAGPAGMPAALGWHPWFRRPAEGAMSLQIDASEVLQTAADLIPTGRTVPVDATTDLRSQPALGARRLDHVYVDARSRAVLAWPDLVMEVAFEPPLATIVVHTPRAGVCVEPQTAWPNAFALASAGNDSTGLLCLEPDGALRARATLRWKIR